MCDLAYPKTYLDRGNQPRKFYFVSYSHKDRDSVFAVLDELYNQKVNYWYDVELDPGDVWNKRVEKYIKSDWCIGAIWFVSVDSILSKAVYQELSIMNELQEDEKPEFRIIPVIIGAKYIKNLIPEALKNPEFYDDDDRLQFFKSLAKGRSQIVYEQAVSEISAISEKDNVKDGHYLNVREFDENALNYVVVNGEKVYTFGEYPFDENGEKKPIEWKLISNTGNRYYFLSKYCIDFVGVSYIDKTIAVVRNSIINSTTSKNAIENVFLITEEFLQSYCSEITHVYPTNYADKNRQQLLRLFWVSTGDGSEKSNFSLYNSQNVRIQENILREQINAGIRLVLVLNNLDN